MAALSNKSGRDSGLKRFAPRLAWLPKMLFCLLLLASACYAADVNVLIVADRSFDGAGIQTQLQNILGGAGVGTVNVTLENTYTSSGRNLATWYHETGYSDEVTHLARLANLRGESGTVWNYVVLLEDRETLEKYPGQYCVGVSDIYKEIKRGANSTEVVLMTQWPATVSTNRVNTVEYYNEVAYRVGRSLGLKVAPAGKAWDAAGRPSGTTQKNKDAAYIAAATLYSQIWNKSAATSTYSYNATLAQTAWTTVTNNLTAPQYSGSFTPPNHVYKMAQLMTRELTLYKGRESSTEGGFASEFAALLYAVRLQSASSIGIGMARPGDGIPSSSTVYGSTFSMGGPYTANGTDIYRLYSAIETFLDSGDYYGLSADSFLARGNTNERHMPEFLMYAQYRRENSFNIIKEGQHITQERQRLDNAFMFTLRTGRCPLPGPANYGNTMWDAVRIGYETAWRMATLQGRVPGFKSLPSSRVHYTVDPTSPETMQVYFLYPPKSNVTVTVSTDQAFAHVSPQTLTFTPTNYSTPQNVIVSVDQGSVPTTAFNVIYNTSSGDEVYNGLMESWRYQVNRRPTANNQTIAAYSGFPKQVVFTGTDPDDALFNSWADAPLHYAESHGYRIITPPAHGTIKIFNRGDDCTYTANPGYTGPDSFTFVRYDWNTNSISAEATVTVNVTPQPLYGFNLIKNGEATLSPINEFYWTTQSGSWNADNDDFRYSAAGLVYQDVDVSSYAFDIDDGRQVFTFKAYWRTYDQWPSFDDFRFVLECRDGIGQLLQTVDSGVLGYIASGFQLYQRNVMPPAGTRTVRVIMKTTYGKKGYVADNLSLVAQSGLNEIPIADYQSGVIASAGVSNTITLTASDADGDALTYIIVDQPQHGTVTVNGTGPTVSYVPDAAYLGADSFTFKVNDIRDDSNVARVDTIVVANQAPTVTITSPTRDTVAIPFNVGVLLKATVTDDAKPAPATITWSKVSGPGTVTFESPNSADTAVSFNNVQGTYVLRLTLDDGQYSASDTVTIEVGYYDQSKDNGPYVLVGAGYVGTPGVPIVLNAVTIFDDGLPNPPAAVQIFWRLVSGPGGLSFSSTDVQNPTVTFPVDGAYVLRVSAFDGATETYHDVNATISSGNLPPVAKSQTVEVDKNSVNNSITLNSTDTENDPVTYAVVSQPLNGTVTLVGSGPQVTYTPTAGFGGNDSFTFKARDSKDSNVATVTVKVRTAPVVNAGVDRIIYLDLGSHPWTPADLISTAAWYDAADASKVQTSGTAVTNWLDKSANNLHLSQSTASLQPATGATINGLNAINFTGDIMGTASNPFGATINNAFVIAVHKVDAVAQGNLFNLGGSWTSHAPWSDGKLYFDTGSSSAPNRISASYGVSAGSVVLTSWYGSTSNNVQQVYKNGTLLVGDSSGHAVSTSGMITVGGSGTSYQDTTLGEFIIINGTVDAATRQKLEGYLAHKWGMTANLPAAHPYKSAAPIYGVIPTVSLDGTVTDANGDDLTTAWTVTEGVATVNNPTAIDTTANVTTAGFYTFRLTANDGTFQPYDDVRIEVRAIDTNNAAPVAQAQAVRVGRNSTGNAIVLTATDAENNALTYAIKTYPVNGTLSGTAPNLTYTPNTSFTGSDSFTFTASDFQQTSAPATVSITINSLPTVDAGMNQTVVMQNVPWTPVRMTTAPSLWYDASDASSIVQSSGAVSQWNDKSGSAKHLTQATATAQPKTGTRTINGLNAIEFDGTNDVLLGVANKTDAITIFGVVQVDSGSGTDANRSWLSAPGGANPDYWMQAPANADTLGAYMLDTTGSGSSASPAAARNSAHIHAAYSWVPGGAAGGVRVDGGTPTSLAVKATALQKLATELAIGRQKTTTGRFHDGLVGEVIIINRRLTEADDEFLRIEGYLAHKWGLTAKLPAGHPYKSTMPVFATATLDATAYDADADSFTTTWSVASTVPVGLPLVTFASASAVDTTAMFYQVGQYTLRLTATAGADQGSDTVVITVIDGSGNTAPVAFDDAVTTNQGVPVGITLNALDADGNSLAYIVSNPTHGTLSYGAVPDVLYTPAAGFSGTDSFTFKVNDGIVDSNTATVTITVVHVNTPPVIESQPWANPNPVTRPSTTTLAVIASDDGLPNPPAALTYTWSTVSGPGTVTYGANNGTATGDSCVAGFSAAGTYVIKVVVSDSLLTASGQVSVTVVDPVNTPPVANAQSVSTAAGTAKAITLTGSDAENHPLTYAIVSPPAHGTLSGTAPNVTYLPAAGFSGTDSFTFKVNDGTVDSNTATVTITVNSGNPSAPPVAGYSRWFDASKITGVANGGAVTTWQDLSGNNAHATVPSGNAAPVYVANAGTGSGLGALYFARNSGPSNSAALRFAADGNIRTVFAVFKGSSFLLTAASTYHFHRPGDTNAADPLWNATYVSANIKNGATYVNGTQVNGTTTPMPTTLNNGFNLVEVVTTGPVTADSFNKDRTYHAGNQYHAEVIIYDRALTEAERLSVESYLNAKWFGSAPVNIAPTANAGTDQTTIDTDGNGTESVTLNGSGSSDSDGTIASYVWTEGATQIATGATPAVTLSVGTHTITLTVTDDDGATATDAVVVTVNEAPNQAPVADGQSVSTSEGTAKAITIAGSDADGDPLTYAIVSQPVNGTLSGTAPNLTYTPNAGFSGSDSFTFKVNDGQADSNVATVSITVEKSIVPVTVRYEAEKATISGATVATNNAGYSGTGFVDYMHASGDYVEWSVTSDTADNAQLVFGYALSSGDRPLEIRVNGVVVSSGLSFPATGSWTNWRKTAALTVTLNAGTNTIRATAIGSSGANVDYLEVTH